ncbi:MAG: Gfo/Idh/MocA family oxidoreductase [Verrucomicrobiota bacterium]
MKQRLSRRQFVARSAFATGGLMTVAAFPAAGKIAVGEKLNVGVIGVAHRGGSNLQGVSGENVVALCDVDQGYLQAALEKHKGARTYRDFRELLEHPDLDAVVVSTPDHTHAVATVTAMNKGYHVYVEKPLTRTVSECRRVMETARRMKRVTQIGTQIHAENNYRRVVELIQAGVIGAVKEVHVWVNVTYGGKDLPADRPPVPANLDYELWLGPVAGHFYHPAWIPAAWRNWWAFGGGGLGDFGCHYMDLPFWALGLQTPLTVEVLDGPAVHPHSVPPQLVVRYEFPARGAQPPVALTWYHGGKHPQLVEGALYQQWKSGVLFVGSEGMVISNYGQHALLPEAKFANFTRPPQTIPQSLGHHKEWIAAIKTGGKPLCNFDYSGPLTETVLLGNAAFRVGKKLIWDSARLQATNCPEANAVLQHQYRKGWTL